MLHHHVAGVGHDADFLGVQVPLCEDLLDLALAARLDDHEHAFLRLGEHDLVGVHAGLALRHAVELDRDAGAAAAGGLAGGTGEACRTHVLNTDDEARNGHHLEARLDQQLLHERVTLLHCRAVLVAGLAELLRGKRRATQAVAAGGRAHIVNGIADAGGLAEADLVVPQHTEAQRIDERVALVARVEIDVAAHRRHADAIAVMRDAGHDAPEQAFGGG